MRFALIFLVTLLVISSTRSQDIDLSKIVQHRGKQEFFQRNGIDMSGYKYDNPELNYQLEQALLYRSQRNFSYAAAIGCAVLGTASFILIRKDEPDTKESFTPLVNGGLVLFGTSFYIDSVVGVFRGIARDKKMKVALASVKELHF